MSTLNDHELTVLVEAAASGAVNSQAAHHGGQLWETLTPADKNNVREAALPFIFHGTKALDELGYSKARTVTTAEDLGALPVGAMILSGGVVPRIKVSDDRWVGDGRDVDGQHIIEWTSYATVIHEPQP